MRGLGGGGGIRPYHERSGEIFGTTYSDATPPVTNHFDRLGRSTNIIDGAGSRFLVYSSTGQVISETNTAAARSVRFLCVMIP